MGRHPPICRSIFCGWRQLAAGERLWFFIGEGPGLLLKEPEKFSFPAPLFVCSERCLRVRNSRFDVGGAGAWWLTTRHTATMHLTTRPLLRLAHSYARTPIAVAKLGAPLSPVGPTVAGRTQAGLFTGLPRRVLLGTQLKAAE